MTVVGRTYLERGEPVEILAQWRGTHVPGDVASLLVDAHSGIVLDSPIIRPSVKRNVLIRRADGTLVVRPFRGLRRQP